MLEPPPLEASPPPLTVVENTPTDVNTLLTFVKTESGYTLKQEQKEAESEPTVKQEEEEQKETVPDMFAPTKQTALTVIPSAGLSTGRIISAEVLSRAPSLFDTSTASYSCVIQFDVYVKHKALNKDEILPVRLSLVCAFLASVMQMCVCVHQVSVLRHLSDDWSAHIDHISPHTPSHGSKRNSLCQDCVSSSSHHEPSPCHVVDCIKCDPKVFALSNIYSHISTSRLEWPQISTVSDSKTETKSSRTAALSEATDLPQNVLTNLPDEMIDKIFTYLYSHEMFMLMHTSKATYHRIWYRHSPFHNNLSVSRVVCVCVACFWEAISLSSADTYQNRPPRKLLQVRREPVGSGKGLSSVCAECVYLRVRFCAFAGAPSV